MKKRLQPPLKSRHTRIRLLLWSYEDAAIGSNEGSRGSKPQSRALSRNPELWNHGAFPEIERAVDLLRSMDNAMFREIEQRHIGRPWHLQPEATAALERIAEMVPRCDWQVPQEISEAAGYLPYEAREWRRLCGGHECRVCRRAA